MTLVLLQCFSCSSAPVYRSNDETVVMNISKTPITADMYRYYYCSYRQNSPEYTEQELKQTVEDTLRDIVAVIETIKEYRMTLPEEDIKQIQEEIVELKDSYDSDEEFLEALDKHFMSEQMLYDSLYYDRLQELLYGYMTLERSMIIDSSNAAFEKALNESFLAAVNIVISDDSFDPDDPDLKGEELAKSIALRIESGESIYQLAEKYSVDAYVGDRYFAPLTMLSFFEEKVRSLKIGEVSGVYKCELGWCITKRVAIDEEYVNENLDSLRENFKYSEYLKIMTERSGSLNVEYTDAFDSFFKSL